MTTEISGEASIVLFAEIEPSLTGIAAKLGVPDPAGEARSWYARFIDIVSAFNTGRLHREIHRDDGTIEEMPSNPSEEQILAFKKSLKAYLKTAFKHDLIQAFNKRKRFVQFEEEAQAPPENPGRPTTLTHEEIIRLSDLIALIQGDAQRKRRSATLARDRINYLFLLATLKFYKKMLHDFGDIPIVRDLHAKDSRDFFIFDVREGRTEAIGIILQDLIDKESAKAVKLCSRKLLNPDKGYLTLNRKISRYFNDSLGGMPFRLKKARLGHTDDNEELDL